MLDLSIRDRNDAGMSMVETVISLLLLAVLSLALLPLIMGLTVHSAGNSRYLQATGLAEEILGKVQSDFPAEPGAMTSCTALQSQAGARVDPAGELTATVSVGACPAAFPGSTKVIVTVSEDGAPMTSVASRVRVGMA